MTAPYDPDACPDCGHDPDAHDMRALDSTCSDCPDVAVPCYAQRLTAAAIRAAIVQDDLGPVIVEQTGGGTATLYVGTPDAAGRYAYSIGPGSYDWRIPWDSTFHPDELSVGPDDDSGSGEPVETIAAVVAYLRARS